MGGQNPYIADSNIRMPTRRYRITIIDEQKQEHVLEVDPAKLPFGDHGLPGSILDICMGNGIELDHACGGVCACSTCHVYVREGLAACNEATEAEEDQLDEAYALRPNSRLGCQCVPDGTKDVVIEIPTVNRNLAREPHSAETMSTKPE
ncbi:MAG: 2Fe-2S iron-sulfur cluster-binding protein [Phycisphaerae bacterium]|nr:2Fe-2S iron-sulfur cluster-binding protein [Phycisphaerae bacterium]